MKWLFQYTYRKRIKHTFFDFNGGTIVIKLCVSPGLGKARGTDCPLCLCLGEKYVVLVFNN